MGPTENVRSLKVEVVTWIQQGIVCRDKNPWEEKGTACRKVVTHPARLLRVVGTIGSKSEYVVVDIAVESIQFEHHGKILDKKLNASTST